MQSIADNIQAHAIGETLKQGAKFPSRLLDRIVTSKLTMGVLAVVSDSTTVFGIFFDSINKPTNRLLVVLVLLALDDNLRWT